MNIVIVISTWVEHPPIYLERLLDSIKKYPAGIEFDLCLSANGKDFKLSQELSNEFDHIFIRENIGFNIGAWDYAWRQLKDYDHFLFLQDECLILKSNWLKMYVDTYENNPEIGLLGENYQKSWDKPWDYLIHDSTGKVSAKKKNNALLYYETIKSWDIDPGKSAGHLTTVVQFIKRDLLLKIHGYQVEEEYQLAIAAEIGFSKKVESTRYKVYQISKHRHKLIGHPQWPSNDLFSRLSRSFKKRYISTK